MSNVRRLTSVFLAALFLLSMLSIPHVYASQEIVNYISSWAGSCFYTTLNQKACGHITGQLFLDTGEIVKNGDFYILVLRYWDDNNTLTNCAISGKWDAWITITTPSTGSYVQSANPQSGSDNVQSGVSFTFGGISVSLLIPAENRQLDISGQSVHWGIWGPFYCTFDNYAELSFSFSVPEGNAVSLSIKVVSDSCTTTGYNCGSSPGDTSKLPTSSYTLTAPAGHVDPPSGYQVAFYSGPTGGGGCSASNTCPKYT